MRLFLCYPGVRDKLDSGQFIFEGKTALGNLLFGILPSLLRGLPMKSVLFGFWSQCCCHNNAEQLHVYLIFRCRKLSVMTFSDAALVAELFKILFQNSLTSVFYEV